MASLAGTSMRLWAGCSLVAVASVAVTVGAAQDVVRIVEPATLTIDEMYRRADVVARVEITLADAEHYRQALYKATVVEGFKGAKTGDSLHFGPFIGYRLGEQYLLFASRERSTVGQAVATGQVNATGFDAAAPVFTITQEGYSSLELEYACEFETRPTCDDSVRVYTDYVTLPDGLQMSPEETAGPFGLRWVRQRDMTSLLRSRASKTERKDDTLSR
jgi:hypothetical protein